MTTIKLVCRNCGTLVDRESAVYGGAWVFCSLRCKEAIVSAINYIRSPECLVHLNALFDESGFRKEFLSYLACAEFIARKAHKGQVDKAGRPYFEHIQAVVDGVTSEAEKIVAYLHDIAEDTEWTVGRLRSIFPPYIVDAVCCLTRTKDESYVDYIQQVKRNKLATEVKKVDLWHNMDLSRLKSVTYKDLQRAEKYRRALKELNR